MILDVYRPQYPPPLILASPLRMRVRSVSPPVGSEARVESQFPQRLSEFVGDEGVEEGVETAVDVEEKGREGRNVHQALAEFAHVRPLLPLETEVVGKHANAERNDHGYEQADNLPPIYQRIPPMRRRRPAPTSAAAGAAGRQPRSDRVKDGRDAVPAAAAAAAAGDDGRDTAAAAGGRGLAAKEQEEVMLLPLGEHLGAAVGRVGRRRDGQSGRGGSAGPGRAALLVLGSPAVAERRRRGRGVAEVRRSGHRRGGKDAEHASAAAEGGRRRRRTGNTDGEIVEGHPPPASPPPPGDVHPVLLRWTVLLLSSS